MSIAHSRNHTKLAINYAEPNWNYSAQGISCRLDWKGASVYEFDKSHMGRVRILAYSLKDAIATLEALENEKYEAWERENKGIESAQESFA